MRGYSIIVSLKRMSNGPLSTSNCVLVLGPKIARSIAMTIQTNLVTLIPIAQIQSNYESSCSIL